MRRYANRNRDMMGYDPSLQPPIPSPSKLDPKDERLVEQAEEIGWHKGQNDLLAEDNGRLEDENRSLKERNQELRERNLVLESQAAADKAGYDSATELIDNVEKALKERKK